MTMPYRVKPLLFKPHRLDGLSARLLDSHYENNYGGALRRLNAIDRQLAGLDPATAPNFVLNGLKREQLVAANSVILHEIYFDGLGGSGDVAGDLANALERDFGSVATWRAEYVAMGKALAGGSGWVLLTWSARLGRLVNQWAADHTHCLADGQVILALDMYEHAYHLDFGANAAAYVDAVMANIHWERVGERFASVSASPPEVGTVTGDPSIITPEDLKAMLERRENVAVLDVRLSDDLAVASDMLPTAAHRDPERIAAWAEELPRDRPVAVYCVYGFWVSQDATAELRKRGVDARCLSGGIAAWHAMGGATVPKATGETADRKGG
jgi:superoxide dismutase, Fe-Mn family